MRPFKSLLLGLVVLGALLLAGVRAGEEDHDHGHEDAEGVGCPVDVRWSLKSNPQRIRRGKVLGLELLLSRIEDWGDAEEIHIGFELPHEEHDDHEHDRRELKTFKAKTTKAQAAQAKAVKAKAVKTKAVKAKGDKAKDKKAKPKAKAAPVKAAQGGEEEHEHMPFIYRNGIIKPRLFPKVRDNWPHYEHHDGLLEWDLEKDMTYSAHQYRFLVWGTVEKEWEYPYMEFHAFIHNATGYLCDEIDIEVPVF